MSQLPRTTTLEEIIEQAQTDLRRKAEPAIVVIGEDAAEFAANFPCLVEDAALDAEAITALLTGAHDVFVAACAASLHSPRAPAGTLCPPRPWVCLLCPLATFTPRHYRTCCGSRRSSPARAPS